ncbi:hypothetical protein [Oceanibaculum indicum]|uniref:Uncharacterized protein n=1 Tax=Oceanibaculum indicum P24 TaxID=1207063 RepID=K2J7I9_9PROT|nr:hypothetical protein [Oceanibaculum indicum]EKE70892.1 hypothetical protein P24_15154 [Oceanibaculum indicum P24]
MRITAALSGRLAQEMRAEAAHVAEAVHSSVTGETTAVQLRARGLVDAALPPRAGSRRKPSNAIRQKIYNDGPGRVRGIVYSKFGRREGGRFVDYLKPHVDGADIRPRAGSFMVLPVKGQSRRMDRIRRDLGRLGEDPKLALIPVSGGRFVFVRRASRNRTVLLAWLVRGVRIDPKLNFRPLEQSAASGLARRLSADLAKPA